MGCGYIGVIHLRNSGCRVTIGCFLCWALSVHALTSAWQLIVWLRLGRNAIAKSDSCVLVAMSLIACGGAESSEHRKDDLVNRIRRGVLFTSWKSAALSLPRQLMPVWKVAGCVCDFMFLAFAGIRCWNSHRKVISREHSSSHRQCASEM